MEFTVGYDGLIRKHVIEHAAAGRLMVQIQSQMAIDATPAALWSLITDFAAYPTWQKAVALEGKPAAGEPVRYLIHVRTPFAASQMVAWEGAFTEAQSHSLLCWKVGPPGVFSAACAIGLEARDGRCLVTYQMNATGLLPLIARGKLLRTHKPLMEAYLVALKRKAERKPAIPVNRRARRKARQAP